MRHKLAVNAAGLLIALAVVIATYGMWEWRHTVADRYTATEAGANLEAVQDQLDELRVQIKTEMLK